MQTKAELHHTSGYPTMSSVSSAYTPPQSSTGLYPPQQLYAARGPAPQGGASLYPQQQPYTPRSPIPAGFLMTSYPDSRYQRQPMYSSAQVVYPTTQPSPAKKYKPLPARASGIKTLCLVVFGLLLLGILFGLILAVVCGLTWKSGQWGYP